MFIHECPFLYKLLTQNIMISNLTSVCLCVHMYNLTSNTGCIVWAVYERLYETVLTVPAY